AGPQAKPIALGGSARMADERTQILSITTEQREEWVALSRASGSGWWRIQKGDYPSFVPATMRAKLDGGVMVVSGSTSGTTYVMFGAERVDPPVSKLDIQPFGIVMFSSGAAPGMAVIHHGGWPQRSTPLPADFFSVASSCSTGSYFFARPPEGKTSGTLDELGPGHKGAFEKIVRALTQPSGSAA
ncbi:MAG: hypothetical protein ACHQQS_15870, partial [Thermoanaerobaculales bacterium]